MEKKSSDLEKLKKEYLKFQKKYKLADFKKLNEYFEIEKAANGETDFPLREIRKHIADKFLNLLRFSEMLLSPVNAPAFVFTIIKLMKIEDKKNIEKIYKDSIRMEIDLIELDAEYCEKKEAEFIKAAIKKWEEIKDGMLEVTDSLKKNWDNKSQKNSGGYFG